MANDKEKALRIVKRHKTYVGPGGTMHRNIAIAVEEGIALGRKEGLERAIEIIKNELQSGRKSN